MSDEGDPKPELPPPAPPSPAPPPPPETASQAVSRLRVALDERRRRVARFLLHVRYVFGYLAGGFLVSVPISLGSRIGAGLDLAEALKAIGFSVAYGVVLLVPFIALIPFSRIEWKEMRVPEFQLFELSVTRSATGVSLLLFVLSLQIHTFSKLAEPRVTWTVFVLMLFAWGNIKVQTKLFPEFYK
jgi:hypothetical protein